jgi:hypothetical protein
VEQESPDELHGRQGEGSHSVFVGIVLPPKGDLPVPDPEKPVVGEGDAVRVSSEVPEHVGGSSERRLGVDDPVFALELGAPPFPVLEFLEGLLVSQEAEFSGTEGVVEESQELSSKQPTEYAHGQKKTFATSDPPFPCCIDASGGHHTMNVRVMMEILSPGVQDGQKADAGSEVTWIGGQGEQRFRDGPEQDSVNEPLVLKSQRADRIRNREDHVEVRPIEQLGFAVLEPLPSRGPLALGTVAVAAGVVGDLLVTASIAPVLVSSQSRGSTKGQITENASLLDRCGPSVNSKERGTVVLEHIGHFGPRRAHVRSGVGVVRRSKSRGLRLEPEA